MHGLFKFQDEGAWELRFTKLWAALETEHEEGNLGGKDLQVLILRSCFISNLQRPGSERVIGRLDQVWNWAWEWWM